MNNNQKRTPSYSLIKSAFDPGDCIYVLKDDGEHFTPVKVLAIGRKAFQTEVGEILYEDHGWLWRCSPPAHHHPTTKRR